MNDGIWREALDEIDKHDRETTLEAIGKILEEHPDGEYLFVMIDEAEDHVVLSDYASGDFQMRAFIAQSYLHLLFSGFWGHPEEEEEE